MAFIGKLFNALRRSRDRVSGAFQHLVKEKVSPQSLEQLEETLLASDLGLSTVEDILDIVKKHSHENFLNEVADYMQQSLDQEKQLEIQTPSVMLVVGVNGTGKTTTAAKLAKYYVDQGKKVLLVAADTYRAAAIAQLQQWSKRLNVRMVCNENSQDPSSVLFDGLQSAKSEDIDLVIVDTAGRLHTYTNLMNELEKMARVVGNRFSEFKLISMMTIDANLGQNSLHQAREFAKSVDLDGAVLTKMDGTARGGIVFALKNELNIPVLFVGVGEELSDLNEFDPQEYIHSLLGLEYVEA
ncbi:MAG TPA: signal recognition particle-docking protein FtsY [Candidatus Marinimicrobia bacterium]|nr:signal recognition particle-docking protein FtsY [Candidatus Neomarinimicrobiota bacterium]MDP7094972.1 signal recognition particle-docking protein FtsY [Candidatus Neomarinimicrobiota bacterium]HBR87458.1 signal recognition particle-docking protein FtsY [Candidatus Neomarinimicrobiota bacterium]